VIQHPVTIINEVETAIIHLYIVLPFDALRSALKAILKEVKQVLLYDLIFDLHAAPRFKTRYLVDNPSNLAKGFSFLDDPRNNFKQVDEWLIGQV